MKLTQSQKDFYYRNKDVIDNVVLTDAIKDKHIIHGSRAINAQVPEYLRKSTNDYDIFSKTPKKDAVQMEKQLDKTFGADLFKTKKGTSKGTYKVVNKITNESIVDYTTPKGDIKTKKVGSISYRSLGSIKKQIKKTLRDPSAQFRAKKDREALQRIKLAQSNVLWR